MTNINILKKGDEVLNINEQFLAIKRKGGTVDVYKLMFTEEGEIIIDPVKATTIGYGEGTVEKTLEDGETTLFSF